MSQQRTTPQAKSLQADSVALERRKIKQKFGITADLCIGEKSNEMREQKKTVPKPYSMIHKKNQ